MALDHCMGCIPNTVYGFHVCNIWAVDVYEVAIMNSKIKASYYVGCVDGCRVLSIVKEFNAKSNKYVFILWWGTDYGDRANICYLNKQGYFDSFKDARKAMYKYYGKKWIRKIK